MISDFLVKRFVKNYKNTEEEKVRNSYGFLGGIIGIIINSLLFAIKLSIGLIVGSIAVTADAFNNLSDAASSLITILGFKLSSLPADEEHPFGHGRLEYISGLIVAFMVMMVGIQFIKSSFQRIINPEVVSFETIPFILLLVSILFKIWLSRFNKLIGKRINSSALKAASIDALGDVVTSSTVALSLLLSNWITFPIDGYIGVIVSLIILYSGYSLIKDTLSPLLGESPDEKLANNIKESILSYDNISGVHDLIIHNYGPGKAMASIHAEVPSTSSIVKIHEIIDKAEKEVSEKFNIHLVIHTDPICVDDKEILKTQEELQSILNKIGLIKSMHDFRVVGEGDHKNLIFDIVVDSSKRGKEITDTELIDMISMNVKKLSPYYNCVITIDNDFTVI
ncbi:cation diffusion facilitator family transporter [Clostridium algidicarnis]|uniref:cation diffusion facilitator family transporter n=1 Tax=Clostridium algidicarnis TaxID=37659 RepID=UPI001C0E0949|nr:cation diffusion facilitator family transporter [Clostridium algidicarnis]MBU3204053.1 cation diffusion facilitator family transporter [Clostridium algidicarnis]MBU3212207.1 cation diffusion facilitator family transporter [Clostridium algidicarnis]MBU3221288.1 cation diffusion facilitator family transporter [Clostridium algidicarnis]